MARLSITVVDDYDSLSVAGADFVGSLVSSKPSARVVVATGATPMGLYRELADRARAGSLDTSRVTVFQLDEYLGIPSDDHRSLFGWAVRSFVEPLRIPLENVVRVPADGDPAACAAYDRAIDDSGGYDLAILGIGGNGHIGFNEPPSDAFAPTREVALSAGSVRSNASYWGGEEHVPRRAVTVGMTALLSARKILLLASGTRKREIVRRALLGPTTPEVPASHLQDAEDVTVMVDREAWNGQGRSRA